MIPSKISSTINNNVEFNCMLAAVAWGIGTKTRKLNAHSIQLTPWYDSKINAEKLLQYAQYHGVLFWVSEFVQACEVIEPSAIAEFRHAARELGVKSMLLSRQALSLSKQLEREQIEHVIIKGPAVQSQLYADPRVCRSADDLDILVMPCQLTSTIKLLQQQYFPRLNQPAEKIASFVERFNGWYRWRDLGFNSNSPTFANIDLHWRLADRFLCPVDTAVLLQGKEWIAVNNDKIPSLAFSTHFVFICLHGHYDHFFRLKHLVDVFAAMQHSRFQLDSVLKEAQRFGMLATVQESMAAANVLFAEMGNQDLSEQQRQGIDSNTEQHSKIQSLIEHSCHRQYLITLLERYACSDCFPPRSHRNKQQWSWFDRFQYVRHQLRCRSSKVSALEIFIMRLKYTTPMVVDFPETNSHPVKWYLAGLLKRCFR